MKANICVLVIICMTLSSCTSRQEKRDGVKTVQVDLTQTIDIPVDESKIITLETNDSSIIYDINDAVFTDSAIILYSRSLFKMFDRNGRFVKTFARKGNGPDEFLDISYIWESNGSINISDSNRGAVLSYSDDGTFLNADYWQRELIDKEVYGISCFIPGNAGNGYFSVNTFTDHTYENNPKYSFFDSELNFVRNISGREQNDGSYTPDLMVADVDGKHMLAWEQLRDTLFILDEYEIRPLYAFDFVGNRFPTEKQREPEFFLRFQSFIDGKDVPYASFIKYYQPVDNKIFFSFATSDEHGYIGVLDRTADSVKAYRLVSPNYVMHPFMKLVGRNLYISMGNINDPEANPVLYALSVDEI